MLNDMLKSVSKIYIAYGVTDFRKQINSLCVNTFFAIILTCKMNCDNIYASLMTLL